MGIKGDKLTKDSLQAAELLVGKLEVIGAITAKKMFGGHGIFNDGKMFGVISSKGDAFFKVNATTKQDYIKAGSHQHSKMPYFSIPEKVMGNSKVLISWARKACEVADQK